MDCVIVVVVVFFRVGNKGNDETVVIYEKGRGKEGKGKGGKGVFVFRAFSQCILRRFQTLLCVPLSVSLSVSHQMI